MKKIQLEETHELPPTLSEPSTVLFCTSTKNINFKAGVKKKRRWRSSQNEPPGLFRLDKLRDFNLSKVASANSKAYLTAYERRKSIKMSKH